MARRWVIRENTSGECEVYYNRVARTHIVLSREDALQYVAHRLIPDDLVELVESDGYPRDITRDVKRERGRKRG